MFRKIAIPIAIFAGIQVMNQFLILSGTFIKTNFLSGISNSTAIIGIYQQLFQAATGIVLFRLIFRQGIQELGLNTNDLKVSLKYFSFFALTWMCVILLYVLVVSNFLPDTWAAMVSTELPATSTMAAKISFQSIFPGLGEEILFRGLFINLLAALVFTDHDKNRASKAGIIVLSSLYFATAHIYFAFEPFRITHFDLTQFVMALGCGLFYAVVFMKTKSLLAPFLAHNFSNTTSTICGYIISHL